MLREPFIWQEMERMRRDMNRLVGGAFTGRQHQKARGFPAINVWTNSERGAILTAELPGTNPEDLTISVTGDTLTLKGTRQPAQTGSDARYHRHERVHGTFSRTIQLPYAVDKDKVEATVQKGVLSVSLPRAEAEKPRQIQVSAGQS